MLVVYLNALTAVNGLNFFKQVFLNGVLVLGSKNVVRVDRTFGERIACGDLRTVLDIGLELRCVRNGVSGFLAVVGGNDNVTSAVFFLNTDYTVTSRYGRNALGLTRFEKLLYSGKTLSNIVCRCYTTAMEGTHGKLSTGLTDGLRCDNTDSLADSDRQAVGHILTVALSAHTVTTTASKSRSDINRSNTCCGDRLSLILGNHFVHADNNFTGVGIDNVLGGISAVKSVFKTFDKRADYAHFLDTAGHKLFCLVLGNLTVSLNDKLARLRVAEFVNGVLRRFLIEDERVRHSLFFFAFNVEFDYGRVAFNDSEGLNSLGRHTFTAVLFHNDNVLSNVYETTSKITGVCRFKRGICKTFTSTVRCDEVFERGKTFTEVALNGHFERLTLRVNHWSTPAGKLNDLSNRTTRTRRRHHRDGVEGGETLLHGIAHTLVDVLPNGDNLVISLLVGKESLACKLFDLDNLSVTLCNEIFLLGRNVHIEYRSRDCANGGVFITERLNIIENLAGFGSALALKRYVNDIAEYALINYLVDFELEHIVLGFTLNEAEILRDSLVKYDLADGGLYELMLNLAVDFTEKTHFNSGLKLDFAVSVRHLSFVSVCKDLELALSARTFDSKVIYAEYHVLRRRADRSAVGELENIIGSEHKETRLCLRFE